MSKNPRDTSPPSLSSARADSQVQTCPPFGDRKVAPRASARPQPDHCIITAWNASFRDRPSVLPSHPALTCLKEKLRGGKIVRSNQIKESLQGIRRYRTRCERGIIFFLLGSSCYYQRFPVLARALTVTQYGELGSSMIRVAAAHAVHRRVMVEVAKESIPFFFFFVRSLIIVMSSLIAPCANTPLACHHIVVASDHIRSSARGFFYDTLASEIRTVCQNDSRGIRTGSLVLL